MTAKELMTQAAVATLRGDPQAVEKANRALAMLREVNPKVKQTEKESAEIGLSYEQRPEFLAWYRARTGYAVEGPCHTLAGLRGGRIVFVVVYSHFSARGCELSIATDMRRSWASRRVLRAILSVPFAQWGLGRVSFLVAADNVASLKMMRQLGAVVEGRLRHHFAEDVDGIVFGLLKTECRWLKRRGTPPVSAMTQGFEQPPTHVSTHV